MKQTFSMKIHIFSEFQHCSVLGWDRIRSENLCILDGKKHMCKPLNFLEIIQTPILKQSDSSIISLDERIIISTRGVAIKVSTNIVQAHVNFLLNLNTFCSKIYNEKAYNWIIHYLNRVTQEDLWFAKLKEKIILSEL